MSAPARPSADAGASTSRRAVDLTVLGILLLLAALGFQPVYGGVQHLVTGTMALLLGFLIALIGARWSWGPLRMALLTIGVHLVLGTVFAAPSHALWGVVPTPAALWEVIREPVSTWKSVLTVAPPVGTAQGMLGVEWISMLLLSLGAATVVLRTRQFLVAWLFPLALLGVTIVFGTTEAFWPVLRAVPFAVLSLAWLTWRFESDRLAGSRSSIIADTVRAGSWSNPVLRRRVVGGTLVLVLAAGTAVSAQALLDPPEGAGRYALRDTITPPFDADRFVSPLADYRGYRKNTRDTELFRVTGLPAGELITLATLDTYDGHVYEVASSSDKSSPSGAFLRTATGVDLLAASDSSRTATIEVEGYADVWLPTIGKATDRIDLASADPDRTGALAENLYLNRTSGTAIAATGLASGDSIDLTYEPYIAPTDDEQRDAVFAEDDLPEGAEMGSGLEALAARWAGDSESDYERMQSLLRGITTDGTFSHGIDDDEAPSLSGHGARRLLAMLEETGYDEEDSDAIQQGMIGDEEQYAALTAVMARSLGIPARVVMGFEVPALEGGTAVITGDDVTAWVEVEFEGIGWVRFDVVPQDDDTPVEQTPKDVDLPMPQVAQPPPPPAEPPTQPPGALSEDVPDVPDDPVVGDVWVRWALVAAAPILLIALLLGAIVAAKAIRRRRRRLRGSPLERIDGGWQEILDLLADLGRRADPVLTRRETAAQLDASVPGAGAMALAVGTDRAVFGPEDAPEEVVQEHWKGVAATRSAMVAAEPLRRRLRGLFSLRSLRRRAADRAQQGRRERARSRGRAQEVRRAAALGRRRRGRGGRRR
ncbi:transglutaminase-like domain-containing protein [Brachybacterium sp. DNPG3]